MRNSKLPIGILLAISLFLACQKDSFITDSDAHLDFSTDTISFDTVFTTIGSATLNFKIYNPYDKFIRISSVYLAGGDHSFFRINFDGVSANEITDVEIPPKDSLFIFVEVTVDPLGVNNPMIIKDSLVFITNGITQDVKLIAYGQDVHLVNGKILNTSTWHADKPYLIYNSMAVDTGATLSIDPGVHVYLNKQSSIIVWGKLLVNGTLENPVIFQGDRLEEDYQIVSGQWGTIYFDPISTGNVINYAIITNSIAGIQIGYPTGTTRPSLTLSNTIIQNVSYAGIYAFNAEINCFNTVVANGKEYLIALLCGGKYDFGHCTFFNFGVSDFGLQTGGSRSNPLLILTNYFDNPEYNESIDKTVYVRRKADLEEANFRNCILYGNLDRELFFGKVDDNAFNYYFDHCLIKENSDSINIDDAGHYNSILLNKDPNFVNDTNRFKLDFRLDTLSPAKDSGSAAIITANPFLELDYDGNSRLTDGAPDLGAFERKED